MVPMEIEKELNKTSHNLDEDSICRVSFRNEEILKIKPISRARIERKTETDRSSAKERGERKREEEENVQVQRRSFTP